MSVPPIDIDEYNIRIHNQTYIDNQLFFNNKEILTIMDYRGDYVSQNYEVGDIVFYQGNTYICILDTVSSETPDNTTYWRQLSNLSNAREVSVAQFGGDFTSINAALTAVNAGNIEGGVPTQSNQIIIKVYSGTYNEPNPIVVPSFVTIKSTDSDRTQSVQVTPATTLTDTIFQMSTSSNVIGVTARGATGTNGVGFTVPANTFNVYVKSCIVEACETGYLTVGAGTSLSTVSFFQNCIARGTLTTTLTNGFRVTNGGFMSGSLLGAFSQPTGTFISNGFLIEDAFSNAQLGTCKVQYCNKGFVTGSGVANQEPLLRVTSGEILNTVITGVEIGADTKVELYSVSISGSIGQDVTLLSSSSSFTGTGNKIREDLILNNSNGTFVGSSLSQVPGESAISIKGELHVGSVEEPTESTFGGGDSHIRGMTILRFDGVSTFTDITNDVKFSEDGLTAEAFDGTGIGNILYVGGSIDKFPNIKMTITTGVTPTSATELITTEYWNGSSWASFNLMSTDSSAPYLPHARELFNSGSYQYRFNILSGWATTTVDSISSYWVRFRISSTGMTVVPILDQIKLGTNRIEINKDGFVEYFGTAQTLVRLPFDINWLRPADSSPSNLDLFLQDTISVGRTENEFQPGVTDRSGFLTELPEEIDTSRPLILRFRFRVSSANTGNIDTDINWGYNVDIQDDPSPSGTTISSVFPSTATAPTTAPGFLGNINTIIPVSANVENRILTQDFELDISKLVPNRNTGSNTGDILWVSFQRNGSAGTDTYTGDASTIQITPYFSKWCEGAYQAI